MSANPETESAAVADVSSKLHRATGSGGGGPETQSNGIIKPRAAVAEMNRKDWIKVHINVNDLIVLDTLRVGKGEKEQGRAPAVTWRPQES